LNSKGKLEPTFLSVSSSHKSYNWGDGRPAGRRPQRDPWADPLSGGCFAPPFLPEAAW